MLHGSISLLSGGRPSVSWKRCKELLHDGLYGFLGWQGTRFLLESHRSWVLPPELSSYNALAVPLCSVLLPLLACFCDKLTYNQTGGFDHSVFDTFVQLTEGRSARDQPQQPPAKKNPSCCRWVSFHLFLWWLLVVSCDTSWISTARLNTSASRPFPPLRSVDGSAAISFFFFLPPHLGLDVWLFIVIFHNISSLTDNGAGSATADKKWPCFFHSVISLFKLLLWWLSRLASKVVCVPVRFERIDVVVVVCGLFDLCCFGFGKGLFNSRRQNWPKTFFVHRFHRFLFFLEFVLFVLVVLCWSCDSLFVFYLFLFLFLFFVMFLFMFVFRLLSLFLFLFTCFLVVVLSCLCSSR